jgi:hypothetical protein
MPVEHLRANRIMAHLLDSLEQGKDIGHYGRLVFAMVARHFMSENELLDYRLLIKQVEGRDYNPPRRDRILEWQGQKEFPICPDPDDPTPATCTKI